MRYIVKIYKDGELLCFSDSPNGVDWGFIKRNYEIPVSKLEHKLGCDGESMKSTGVNSGYTLIFNTKTLKPTVYSYKTRIITDFKDKNGKKIILDKVYSSVKTGDTYSIHEGYNDSLYMRQENDYMWISYHDIEGADLTQELIDSLKLQPTK